MGGPQDQSGQARKISPPPGFDPWSVQPVASRYTDWATGPNFSRKKTHLFYVCFHEPIEPLSTDKLVPKFRMIVLIEWTVKSKNIVHHHKRNVLEQCAKERMFLKWVYLPAISFFGVTSNQNSMFENLVKSTIWKFPFAKKLQLCHKKC